MRFLPCILASLFYGIKPTLVNLAIGAGESGNAIEFWGMLLTCLLAAIVSLVRHDSLRVNPRQFFEMTLFGLCGFFLSSFFLLSAYKLLPVSTTLLFHFCYPALVSLFMACFFHQRMTPARGTAIMLSLAGISGGRGMLSQGRAFSALKEDTSMEGVAGAALWLLSDLGFSTTGEVVHVDAGFHMIGLPDGEAAE